MRRVEWTPLIAAAAAGFAAWLSIGSLAVATPGTASRIGFLPPFWLAFVLVAGFGLTAWVVRLSRTRALPLLFSLVLLLPWIPGPVPAAFLLWTGPGVIGVWLAVIAGMVASKPIRLPSQPLLAAAIAFASYLGAGWWLSAVLPNGDEPHYLVITQSLLRDGDIQVENNYAGGQYREYFPVAMNPHYGSRGANRQRYSIHAPGLAAVIAPSFVLFGYPGVVVFLALIAAAGGALLWRASYQLTGQASAAWFAWAAGALTVPFFFQAFSVYPDGFGAPLVLLAILPLVEERLSTKRWIATGAALGLMPWLHTRFAIISAMLGLVLLLRLIGSAEGRSRIIPFLSVPVASSIGWFAFFRVVYGRFDPSAAYGGDTQTSAMNVLNGMPALLFDQQFGVLPNAPVYGFCFAGLVVMACRRTRLAIEIAAVALPYLVAVSAFQMWWAGTSAPARFLAPILPLMALPAAWLWSSTPSRSTRAAGLAALLMSLVTTAMLAGVEGGSLAYNVRDGYSRAAEWINPVVDVSLGMPSFFRQTSHGALLPAAIWIGFLAAAVLSLRVLDWRKATRSAFALATPVSLAIAIMSALTAVWALDHVAAPNPEKSQLSLLADYDSAWRPNGVALQPPTLDGARAMLPQIAVATPMRRGPSPAGTLLLAPTIVRGGAYELRLGSEAQASGPARLVIGRAARPIRSWDLATDFRDGAATVELPVNVGSLVVLGDRGASPRALTLHPTRIWEGSSQLTSDIARRVERYGPALVFFFDLNDTHPEDQGFWVLGGRTGQIAVTPAESAPLQMFVRNAAAANQVRVEIDGAVQVLELQSREERTLSVPIGEARPGALIRIHPQTGFRPLEVEPGSTDRRFLGAWIEFR